MKPQREVHLAMLFDGDSAAPNPFVPGVGERVASCPHTDRPLNVVTWNPSMRLRGEPIK